MKKIFTQFFLFATLFLASANLNAQTNNNGTWYSLYDASGFELYTIANEQVNVYAPVGGTLTFDWKYSYRIIGGVWKSHDTYIYESSDGGSNYSGEKGHISGTGSGTGSVSLSTNINKIKFDRPTGNTNTVKYTNIKLPLKKHILLASGDYGTTSVEKKFANPVNINETSSALTVKLRSFLTAGNINITSDNPAFYVATSTYAVGANACASANGAAGNMAGGNTLGNINHYDVHIYFHPTSAGTHNGTITLTDGTSTATIKVSGTCNKIAQTITWNDNIANIKTTDNITLNATATTAITYTSSDENIAEVNGSTLKINKHGKVTITATAAETDIYASASQTKEVTISATVPEVTSWPQVAPLTYGTPLTLDMLVGGTANVPGNFEFADLSTTLNAGTHNLVVRFIPEDQNIYAIVEGTVPVTINKAAQTITWDFTDQEITVGTTLTLNASATFGEVTFSIEDNGVASLEGNTLTAIKAGTVTITASQAGNDNYAAAESITHTVTVNKATPIITTMPTLASVVYGATLREALTLVGGEATVNGVTVEGEFTFVLPTHADYLDQVPTVGEHTFDITFLPVATECYNEVDTVITLLVTKELQTITWDFADQEVLIGTTLNLNATATSGEVTFSIECEEGIASLEGNTVTALKAGVVTITASVSGNKNYEPATVSYTITIIKHTPEIIVLPTVAPIGIDTELNNDMLIGGETSIDGTWEFVTPTQSLNMGNNEVIIRFTPTNTDMYAIVEVTIIVVVEKAETTIDWELESNVIEWGEEIYLYAETSNGDIVTTFAITGPERVLQYDSEWMTLTAIGYGTTTVTAYAPETETHKAAELSYEITVFNPNNTTGVTNNTISDGTQKCIINGELRIIRDGKHYDSMGRLVK